jgi:hypothetical protein
MKKYIIVLVLAIGLPLSFAYGQHRSKIKVAYPSMLNSQEQEDISLKKIMSKYLKNHYFVQNENFYNQVLS